MLVEVVVGTRMHLFVRCWNDGVEPAPTVAAHPFAVDNWVVHSLRDGRVCLVVVVAAADAAFDWGVDGSYHWWISVVDFAAAVELGIQCYWFAVVVAVVAWMGECVLEEG